MSPIFLFGKCQCLAESYTFSLLDVWAKLASDVVIKYWQHVLQLFHWCQYTELYCACHSDWPCRNDVTIMLQCQEIHSTVCCWSRFWIFPPSPLWFKHLIQPVVMRSTPFVTDDNWERSKTGYSCCVWREIAAKSQYTDGHTLTIHLWFQPKWWWGYGEFKSPLSMFRWGYIVTCADGWNLPF